MLKAPQLTGDTDQSMLLSEAVLQLYSIGTMGISPEQILMHPIQRIIHERERDRMLEFTLVTQRISE